MECQEEWITTRVNALARWEDRPSSCGDSGGVVRCGLLDSEHQTTGVVEVALELFVGVAAAWPKRR